jgi:hypothetical protein
MPDSFDQAKNDILRGSQENGGLTPRNLFDLISASHETTMDAIADIRGIVGGREEAIEAAKREVIAEVEKRERWPVLDKACEDLRASIAEIAARQPRRENDPPSVDFRTYAAPRPAGDQPENRTMQEIFLGWRFSKWLVGLVLVGVIGWALPFWADSCSRAQYWGKTAPTIAVTATPTPSPTVAP